jgi:uncharacterized membrane protein
VTFLNLVDVPHGRKYTQSYATEGDHLMKYISNITLTLMGLVFFAFAIVASYLPYESLVTTASILITVTAVLVVAALRVEKLIVKRRSTATV